MNNLEAALRSMILSVVKEVATELRRELSQPVEVRPRTQPEPQPEILLTSREAAKRLAISERHLFSLTAAGEMPCVRLGRNVRYSVETIKKWIQDAEKASQESEPLRERKPPMKTGRVRLIRKVVNHNLKTARPRKELSCRTPKPTQADIVGSNVKQQKIMPIETLNPFRKLLEDIGIDQASIPSKTHGELRRIAEVDVATLHGWMHLGRALPEIALQKLRNHFLSAHGQSSKLALP